MCLLGFLSCSASALSKVDFCLAYCNRCETIAAVVGVKCVLAVYCVCACVCKKKHERQIEQRFERAPVLLRISTFSCSASALSVCTYDREGVEILARAGGVARLGFREAGVCFSRRVSFRGSGHHLIGFGPGERASDIGWNPPCFGKE